MERCDMLDNCKLYQKHQDTEDELWMRIRDQYCNGSAYKQCSIRNHIKVYEVNTTRSDRPSRGAA